MTEHQDGVDRPPTPAHPRAESPVSPDHFEEGEEAPPPGVQAMALLRWALVALVGFATLFAFLRSRDALPPTARPSAGPQYFCPMHPAVTQDVPGECPICSMTLVARVPSATSEPQATKESPSSRPPLPSSCGVPGLGAVTLTPERVQLIGMRTATAARERLPSQVETVGFVSADESRRSEITIRFEGWIEQLWVSRSGARVKKGQVLATVYGPEIFAAQSEFVNAVRWSRAQPPAAEDAHAQGLARPLLEGARRKLELLGVSEEEIDELARAGQEMRGLKIRSPVSGTVLEKHIVVGSHVAPGAVLFSVADLTTVWVLAEVYEHEMARVEVGAQVQLSLAAYPDRTFSGRVHFIHPTVETHTRTLRVRMEFRNQEGLLKPGMYGDVAIRTPAPEGLVIPSEALIDTGRAQYVFLALAGGRFEPRRVQVGPRAREKVQILEGLEEGDRVVTTSNFVLDSESRLFAALREIESGAGGAPNGPDSDCDVRPAASGRTE